MEVTPEIYAWLVNLNILDGSKSIKMNKEGSIYIQDNLVRSMMEGFYFDQILMNLQEGYNKFYKIKLNYTDSLKDLKLERPEYMAAIPLNLRNSNWAIIAEVVNNFGIEISKRKMDKITSGNINELLELLKSIYSLSCELSRKSIEYSTALDTSPVRNKMNNKSSAQSNAHLQAHDSSLNKSLGGPGSTLTSAINSNETIDLNTFDETKEYIHCQSPLEFLIVTLCKVFAMKPRQSVALLANNRKYLRNICNKGIKGEFDRISQWYYEISTNMKVFINLLRTWKNGRAVGFATISVGLYSKNYNIAMKAYNLLAQLLIDIGTDWDWFSNEGILALVFCINKHEELRVNLINLIYDFSRKNLKELNEAMDMRLVIDRNSDKLLQFLSSIVNYMKQADNIIFLKLKEYLLNSCLKEKSDVPAAVSILVDAWINFYPLDKNFTNAIVNYVKNGVRMYNSSESSASNKTASVASIINLFRVMRRFRETKKEDANILLKTLVFLFLENYEIDNLREIFLLHFTDFLKKDKSVQIKVLVDPYLRQIKSSTNYDITDFKFLNSIVRFEYVRIDIDSIKNILEFVLKICRTDIRYNKCACEILNIILDKYFDIEKNSKTNLDKDFSKICVSHIKNTLELFNDNIRNFPKKFDTSLLESLYYIISLNLIEINQHVHDEIVETIKYYRCEFYYHSVGLLSLLWFYEDHDDVLLNLEEKFADRNELIEEYIEEKRVKKPAKRPNPQADIDEIKNKKYRQEILKLEENYEKQLREAKIKTNLQKKLEQKSFELGMTSNKTAQNHSQNNSLSLQAGSYDNKSTNDSNMTMIVKEGSIINANFNSSSLYNLNNPYRSSFIPILLDDEEEREQRAIRGLTNEFNKEIKYYFKNYMTEINDTVTKANFLKMLRDLAIGNDALTLEELTVSIRNVFGLPLNSFKKEQFINLLIQISYLVINKVNNRLTISECFKEVLSRLAIPKVIEKDQKLKKIIKYLEDKAEDHRINQIPKPDLNNEEEIMSLSYHSHNNSDTTTQDKLSLNVLLPPGFKQAENSRVTYDHKLPESFLKFLPESKYISIDILNDIIHKSIGSDIIEPFVKIEKKFEIAVDPMKSRHKKWSNGVIHAYMSLDRSLSEQASETADLLEDMLRAIEKGLTTLKRERNVAPMEKFESEQHHKLLEEEKVKEKKRKLRTQFIKKNLELKQVEKEEELKEKEEKAKLQKEVRDNKLKGQLLEEKKLRSLTVERIRNTKREREDEKERKEKEDKERKLEQERKKEAERENFLLKQKRKMREQFKKIKTMKEEISKKQKENFDMIFKIQKDKTFHPVITEKERFYGDFEKSLNTKLEEILSENEEIKSTLENYENHLKIIFDIYYKIAMKIGNFPDELMYFKAFQEFCVNFSIVSLLISKEQMQYIFNKISKRNEGEGEVQNYFRFKDFILSVFYISIMSKFSSKARKIMPDDLEKISSEDLKIIFDFLGLRLPFNKKEIEEFINDRRALSAKSLMKLQSTLKKEKVALIKGNSEADEETVLNNNYLRSENSRSKGENKRVKNSNERSDTKNEKYLEENMKKIDIKDPSGKREKWKVKN